MTKEMEKKTIGGVGSGTTGVACRNTDRNFIGMELEEEYFQIAEKRICE